MDSLVDLFYYDHILSRILLHYAEGGGGEGVVTYLRLATTLNSKFRNAQMKFDKELYLKEMCVKAIQFTRRSGGGTREAAKRLMQDLMLILCECPQSKADPQFEKIKGIVFACFAHFFRSDEAGEPEHLAFIREERGTCDHAELSAAAGFAGGFSIEEMHRQLKTFKFMKPVMCKFVDEVCAGIDKISKKKHCDIRGDAPGEKVGWEG